MTNKAYSLYKAIKAEKAGRYEDACRYYNQVAVECRKQADKCTLMSRMISAMIAVGM